MTATQLDAARQAALETRLVDSLNGAALALMASVGHRTGLFDAMAGLEPATVEGVASAAGLNERYVREWLGAMVTARIVDHDPETQTYWLPGEHAALLTRQAAPNNMAALMQYIPVLGAVEDQIVDCFRHGGGVPYREFHRFHEVMRDDSGQTVLPALFDAILPLVPGGLDALERGADVLDVGCGSGLALVTMAARFPRSRFVGYDFSKEAIGHATAEAAKRGLPNARFEVRDAAALGHRQDFDLVTAFDAIHDQARPRQVLRKVAEALRPGGTFLMQDIDAQSHHHENLDHPIGTLLYTISCMHCMTVSLAEGGEGLGTMWGEQKAKAFLAEAGFGDVEIHRLPHDVQNAYYVARPAA